MLESNCECKGCKSEETGQATLNSLPGFPRFSRIGIGNEGTMGPRSLYGDEVTCN